MDMRRTVLYMEDESSQPIVIRQCDSCKAYHRVSAVDDYPNGVEIVDGLNTLEFTRTVSGD